VLTNIVPSDLRREEKLFKTIKNAEDRKSSLLTKILGDTSALRQIEKTTLEDG